MTYYCQLAVPGGVIILDAEGNVHMPFNTEGMYRASRVGNAEPEVAIYKD